MNKKTRVRFAPSPTGPLHIGGVRTALFNYLFAKKHGGDFILRIEDTDQNRHVEGAEAYIAETLSWLGMQPDEGPTAALDGKPKGGYGPYRQSERKHMYKKYADMLIASGSAYYAFDTAEQLDFHRKDHEAKGKTFIYNWHNRLKLDNSLSLPSEGVNRRIASGEPYVVRFKTPDNKVLRFNDIVRGTIEIDPRTLDDKVLFKSDGMPTYHLANVVDDHLMAISHVIRGEEWLPSLALHILLYRAFNWEPPLFAHLPLLMKPVGKGKLSKRDGDKMGFPVFPLEWKTTNGSVYSGYRENGYLPGAVVNMLAFLGWNPGTEQEIFSLSELTKAFELERVNKAGAKFDPEKALWFQHHYLQAVPDEVLTEKFVSFLKLKGVPAETIGARDNKAIVRLLKERATFVNDLWEQGSFFYITPPAYGAQVVKKAFKTGSAEILAEVTSILKQTAPFENTAIASAIKAWIAKNELGFGKVMMPLRLALVGAMKGPDVFGIASLLGKQEALARISRAILYINENLEK
ncbi:MAG: glutamate--tRNA ligase [Marinirhabdus sp.]